MMLKDVIQLIQDYGNDSNIVRLVVPNDIFRLNTMPDARYPAIGWTQRQHRVDMAAGLQYFSFAIFYVDRLMESKINEVGIQSTGVNILTDLLRFMEDNGAYTYGDVTFTTFNQRFTDECAGAYVSVTFQVPVDTLCVDETSIIS